MENTTSLQPWTAGEKTAFRFCALYLVLFTLPFPLDAMPLVGEAISNSMSQAWNWLVAPAGKYLLGVEAKLIQTGSGDTTWSYAWHFLVISLAALGTLVWTLTDRKAERRYDRWYFWLRILVRYYLAYVLLTYGFFKVIKTQFPFPSLIRLLRPLGEGSPMGLAWDFMGYSTGYNFFTGGMEVLGGLLLFFRRTVVLGAFVAIGVMSNVAAMNFCFDIPVKLYSLNLLLMAFFLLAPVAGPLARFFLSNQAAAPLAESSWAIPDKYRKVALGLKIVLMAVIFYQVIQLPLSVYSQRVGSESQSPLYGIYQVTQFEQNGAPVPPLATDSTRWKRLVLDRYQLAQIAFMNDSIQWFRFKADTTARTISLNQSSEKAQPLVFSYDKGPGKNLTLQGKIKNDSVLIRLNYFDENQLLLVRRGFNWVQEFPFNR